MPSLPAAEHVTNRSPSHHGRTSRSRGTSHKPEAAATTRGGSLGSDRPRGDAGCRPPAAAHDPTLPDTEHASCPGLPVLAAWVGICTALLVLAQLVFGGRSGARGWTGDPRVNVPISDLDPDKIHIAASPFPLADLTTLVEAYAAASLHVTFPQASANITLGLEAPGMGQVNIRSWLSAAPRHPSFRDWAERLDGTRKVPAVLAKDPSELVALANITLTARMMQDLWPRLVDESLNVLSLGLGRDHPEYAALVNLLTPPPAPASSSLYHAESLWRNFHRSASEWPSQAASWLEDLSSELRMWETLAVWGEQQEPLPRVGPSRPPTLAQLLEYARAQPAMAGGRNQTLPQLLSGLWLSAGASIQLAEFDLHLTDQGLGLGKGARTEKRMCTAPDLLEAVAQGQCDNNKTSVITKPYPYRAAPGYSSPDRYLLEALRDALCDAEDFLGPLAAGAEKARDRVKAAIEERGGISQLDSLASRFQGRSLVRRLAVLDRALEVFHVLYPALKLYRPMLAGAAAAMQRACLLQDALRERVHALRNNQSARWNLEWDADSDAAVLTFVVLPELQSTNRHILSAHARVEAGEDWRFRGFGATAVLSGILKDELASGWIQRLGLEGPPETLRLQWSFLRMRLAEILPFPFNCIADPSPFFGHNFKWSMDCAICKELCRRGLPRLFGSPELCPVFVP